MQYLNMKLVPDIAIDSQIDAFLKKFPRNWQKTIKNNISLQAIFYSELWQYSILKINPKSLRKGS